MLISLRNQYLGLYELEDITGANHFPVSRYVFKRHVWGRVSIPGGRELAIAEATEAKLDAIIALAADDYAILTTNRGIVQDTDSGQFYRLGAALDVRQHNMVKLMASLVADDQEYTILDLAPVIWTPAQAHLVAGDPPTNVTALLQNTEHNGIPVGLGNLGALSTDTNKVTTGNVTVEFDESDYVVTVPLTPLVAGVVPVRLLSDTEIIGSLICSITG